MKEDEKETAEKSKTNQASSRKQTVLTSFFRPKSPPAVVSAGSPHNREVDSNGGSGDKRSADGGSGDKRGADGGSGDKRGADGGSGDKRGADGGSGDKRGADGGSGDKRGADGGSADKRGADGAPPSPSDSGGSSSNQDLNDETLAQLVAFEEFKDSKLDMKTVLKEQAAALSKFFHNAESKNLSGKMKSSETPATVQQYQDEWLKQQGRQRKSIQPDGVSFHFSCLMLFVYRIVFIGQSNAC
jgi:hypothetical protein